MADYIDRDAVLAVIEEKQKALCPLGRWGRNYVFGPDRERFDEFEDLIDAITALPSVEMQS